MGMRGLRVSTKYRAQERDHKALDRTPIARFEPLDPQLRPIALASGQNHYFPKEDPTAHR